MKLFQKESIVFLQVNKLLKYLNMWYEVILKMVKI